MSSDKTDPGLVGQVINRENLALLRKSDRFVVLAAGLVVVAALGGVAALRENAIVAMILSIASMVIVAGLVALVQWRAYSLGDLEADIADQAAAAMAVNGDWWQIVRSKDHPGLTYVRIRMAEVAERHAMHGAAFDAQGKRRSRWSTDAVALKTTSPVELYYVWRGTQYFPDQSAFVSGLGRFRFDSVGREQRPLEGEGFLTRGSPNEMEFGQAQGVELVRFTEQESTRLVEEPQCLPQLAREAFVALGIDPDGGETES
jgi:hypothetical protein